MNKYVRTEDGILTAEKFIINKLKKNHACRVRKQDGYYVFVLPILSNDNKNYTWKEIWRTPESDALKIVEETPNRKADAIEELCDCYLEDWGKGIPHIVTKHMMSVWSEVHKGKALRGETTFYACIIKRDGKGTHIEPVAKMNEKGEFELL